MPSTIPTSPLCAQYIPWCRVVVDVTLTTTSIPSTCSIHSVVQEKSELRGVTVVFICVTVAFTRGAGAGDKADRQTAIRNDESSPVAVLLL